MRIALFPRVSGWLSACALLVCLGIGIRTVGAEEPVVYTKHIAPIMYKNCLPCHRPGQVAPMTFMNYQEVRPWAKGIKKAVLQGEMPPWYADSRYGHFRNDRSLSEADIQTIVAWVNGGGLKGEEKYLPPQPTFDDVGWAPGVEPDMVIPMPLEFTIPAEGQQDYTYWYVPIPFKEDRFIRAVELKPGNRAAVHHSIVNVVKIDDSDKRVLVAGKKLDTKETWKLVGQAPGKGYEEHRSDAAKRLAPGYYFEFNLHYSPTGKPEKDRSLLGLWFAKKEPKVEILTQTIRDSVIVNGKPVLKGDKTPNIQPHEANYEIIGYKFFTDDATLYAFSPHMHLRGKDMKYILRHPDGREETLMSVPDFDFNWQLHYELVEPVKIKKGSTLICIAHFDNSLGNPYNPAPHKEVYWGEQSWDEMFSGFIEYAYDNNELNKPQKKTETAAADQKKLQNAAQQPQR